MSSYKKDKGLTLFSSSKQSSCFIFLMSSLGRLLSVLSTSILLGFRHTYRWYILSCCWTDWESFSMGIHSLISCILTLISFDFKALDSRYIWLKGSTIHRSYKFGSIHHDLTGHNNKRNQPWCKRGKHYHRMLYIIKDLFIRFILAYNTLVSFLPCPITWA